MDASDIADLLETWRTGIADGGVVPILGPDSQTGSTDAASGEPLPAQGRDLILALNDGKPMSPKLMVEFSRAAMNIEFKKGRKYVERTLNHLYEDHAWTATPQMRWIADSHPRYVVDFNRDSVLLDLLEGAHHVLIQAAARLSKADPRYRAFQSTDAGYAPLDEEAMSASLALGQVPLVFKPLGCAKPTPSYIAADADYVDFITELMGGFALPPFLKSLRKGKRYLIAGVRFAKDTERMITRDIIHDANPGDAGWLVVDAPSPKELRFAKQQNLTVIDAPLSAFWS